MPGTAEAKDLDNLFAAISLQKWPRNRGIFKTVLNCLNVRHRQKTEKYVS